jgi:hypothetical protein
MSEMPTGAESPTIRSLISIGRRVNLRRNSDRE